MIEYIISLIIAIVLLIPSIMLSKWIFKLDRLKNGPIPWLKKPEIFYPFIIPLIMTIGIFAISIYLSGQTDDILNEIKYFTKDTNDKVTQLFFQEEVNFSIKETSGTDKVNISNKKKEIPYQFTEEQTFIMWVTLNRAAETYNKGFIFDVGDSLVKNRISLYVDQNGFLNWRIMDSKYNIHSLRYDITNFLNGTRFFIALTRDKTGHLTMYINDTAVSETTIDQLNLSINSKTMIFGSDLEGNNIINFN